MKIPIKDYIKNTREQFGTRSSKMGSYSFFLTVVVLAILVTVNIALSFLPDSYVQEDLTANQLYSISSQSKVMLSSLEEDITIYWVVASGEEDEYVEKLLHNYEDYSSRVTVEKKDPDLNPDFTNNYTDETSSMSYYSMYSSADEFAGESLITSAISYCTTEELPVIHILEGHGEAELTESFQEALERDNLETETLSLLNSETVPEEVSCILVNAPSTDISETERDMLLDFMERGGRVLIISGTAEEEQLPNLKSVMENYGISVLEGVVVEENTDNYVYGNPVLLMPEMNSSDITDPLMEDNYQVVVPVSKALDVSEASEDVTVTSLLESSEESFLKDEGYDIETYEQEEGDIQGPLTLAALVTKDLEDDQQMQLVWIASSMMLEEAYNSYSSDANEDFILNVLEMMCEKDDSISVRSKSLTNEYLTISTADSSMIKVATMGVIPGIYLITGIVVAVRRRKR